VATAAALALVRQIYVSGAPPLAPKHPALYLPAGVAAAALGAWAVLRGWRRAPVAAGAFALVLFLANDRVLASGDTHGAALLPYNLVRRGTLALDGLAPSPPPYWVVERDGRAWSRYPVTAALLAVPVYLPAALGRGRPGALPPLEKLAAALLCAVSAGLVLAAALELGAPRRLAVAATLLYAAGSPVLSTASQALWQHGPGVLAVSAALWAALRARSAARAGASALAFDLAAGLACGVAVAARPTNALLAAGVLAATAGRGLRPLAAAALAAAPPVLFLLAYQAMAFGSPLATGYGAEARAFTAPFAEGLAGLLLSPTRGLLPYLPWAALGALGLARAARRDAVLAGAGAGALATLLLYARWHAWWGGWCYGPRMLAELSPVLALGAAALGGARRAWLAPALAATGALAVAVNAYGVFASRSPAAQAVYAVRDTREAMEAWRWPPVAWLGAGRR
jgi:hypothetical protein